jgi:hypothetical protein
VGSLAIFYAMTPLAIVAIFAGLIANRQPAKKTSNYRHKQWLWPLVALALAETIPLFINEKTFASSPPRVIEIIIWYVMVASAPLAIAWILSNLWQRLWSNWKLKIFQYLLFATALASPGALMLLMFVWPVGIPLAVLVWPIATILIVRECKNQPLLLSGGTDR